ncbi:MAG: tRNA (N6-threonylcarbamoyladenosine(37)-N6)-methyltransferase TrmO [Ectothiorhodospiraceae bacterium]|nr:tRNA (N6-threonylcarbamoyladenosine(37)-N6)-methyltransferase TrmO [Ectothiorhodospiraceae bacterium]
MSQSINPTIPIYTESRGKTIVSSLFDPFQSTHFEPIGIIHSCFKEKFGIPRQPGLVTLAPATLELHAPYNNPKALTELEGFSHIWVIFVFHQAVRENWKPTVRPPRLGGNQRIGVFASRSPFRPNPIGLSAVKLEKVVCSEGRCVLHLKGADLLDGTPVLDIKPYLPYADAIPDARGGYAAQAPGPELTVSFSKLAIEQCRSLQARGQAKGQARGQAKGQTRGQQIGMPDLAPLIEQILRADPRPAYCADSENPRKFGMRLYDFDVQWSVTGSVVEVLALQVIENKK